MECKIITFDVHKIVGLSKLAEEAKKEGYRFVQRTIDEWVNGKNDFSKKGEVFYGLLVDDEIVSIGGLNVDPYIQTNRVGRIRHVYTSKEYRHKGYSKIILSKILNSAPVYFDKLRLSTYNMIAASYYEKMGFIRRIEFRATHIMDIKKGL